MKVACYQGFQSYTKSDAHTACYQYVGFYQKVSKAPSFRGLWKNPKKSSFWAKPLSKSIVLNGLNSFRVMLVQKNFEVICWFALTCPAKQNRPKLLKRLGKLVWWIPNINKCLSVVTWLFPLAFSIQKGQLIQTEAYRRRNLYRLVPPECLCPIMGKQDRFGNIARFVLSYQLFCKENQWWLDIGRIEKHLAMPLMLQTVIFDGVVLTSLHSLISNCAGWGIKVNCAQDAAHCLNYCKWCVPVIIALSWH